MIYPSLRRMALLTAALSLAMTVGACADDPATQGISGRISQSSFHSRPLGVRAVQGSTVVARAALAPDGTFQLDVPTGRAYRLEVVTAAGVHPFVVRDATRGTRAMSFDVCDPGEPVDLGMGAYWDENDDPTPDSGGGGGSSDPGMPCDDPTDPNCGCDTPPPPWPCEDPMDPNCGEPWPCDDPNAPDCGEPPPPCEDPMDPNCGDPWPCEDPTDPNCGDPWPCEDPNDPWCTEPPPPPGCEDPMDPNCDPCLTNPEWCQDPCIDNPEWCEDPCDNGMTDPENCWPPPPPCDDTMNGDEDCWWDDPMCPMEDPNCWPEPEPPYCGDDTPVPPDQDPNGEWMDPWDPGTCGDDPGEPDNGCLVDEPPPTFGCEAA